ncbi:MAG: ATP synthase F1 subunit delta [Thermoanaerobaculum sp.]|nr:ATP synthase F1 subunit delta [Thermoanaerobaculum sp.]MDW7967926.1 ATP synthase F1 subunit delta [Thermoanaerobaculum sp.]
MSRRIARPYAQALFAVTKPDGPQALEKAQKALDRAAWAFKELPQLIRAFELPTLAVRQKLSLLRELSRRLELPVKVERLLVALQTHYRLRYLPLVAEEFTVLCDRFFGLRRGRVWLPAAVAPEQLAELEGTLARLVGTAVKLEQEERPELLAGFVVRLGSLVFDGSLRRQLERFAGGSLPEGGRYAREVR